MKKYCYNAIINTQKYEKTFKYNDIDVLILSIKYPIVSIQYNLYAEWLINSQISMRVNDFIRIADYMYDQAVDSYLIHRKMILCLTPLVSTWTTL